MSGQDNGNAGLSRQGIVGAPGRHRRPGGQGGGHHPRGDGQIQGPGSKRAVCLALTLQLDKAPVVRWIAASSKTRAPSTMAISSMVDSWSGGRITSRFCRRCLQRCGHATTASSCRARATPSSKDARSAGGRRHPLRRVRVQRDQRLSGSMASCASTLRTCPAMPP